MIKNLKSNILNVRKYLNIQKTPFVLKNISCDFFNILCTLISVASSKY